MLIVTQASMSVAQTGMNGTIIKNNIHKVERENFPTTHYH